MIQFYDSAFHLDQIANESHVCLYGDGAITGWQVHYDWRRFAAVRWITTLGSPGCGIFDYEQGNNESALKAWVNQRIVKQEMRGRLYCGGNNLAKARTALGSLWDHPRLLHWYPTLDGRELDLEELILKIAVDSGIRLDAASIWAHQYAGSRPGFNVDTSNLLGRW